MRNRSCCFTGHRALPKDLIPEIKALLKSEIITLIEKGYTDFYAGGALGFDTLAALSVLELKKDYPHIKLHIIMPCADQTIKWNKADIAVFESIRESADEVVCLAPRYFNGCMMIRNRHMVDASSAVIAYLTEVNGGSAATVKYASRKNVPVINIAEKLK